MSQPDYLLLGHFTRDMLPDGTTRAGGTSLYAGFTAQRLGMRVAVVSAAADLPEDWPQDIAIHTLSDRDTPTFENRYTPSGRVQILHTASLPITTGDIPSAWRAPPIVHLAPIAAETPEDLVFAFPHSLLGMTPQGMMRAWGNLPGPVQYRLWMPDAEVLERIDALVMSIEDLRGDEQTAQQYAASCRLVALTRGARGATLFIDGQPHEVAAAPATEHDPTGAGDVFAAALLTRLYETGDPLLAAVFAAQVAARSVEGPGVSAVPPRAALSV